MTLKSIRPLFVCLSLATAGCNFLRPHPPTLEERSAEFIHCFRQEFNPTDEQLEHLKSKILVAGSDIRKTAEDLRTTTDKLETLLETEAKDEELKKYFLDVQTLKDKLSADHFEKMLVLRQTLTPQQRSKFLVCKRKLGPSDLPHEG